MNPRHWIDRFNANRTGWNEPGWAEPCEIENPEHQRLLAESLATFQLGETGGGSRLMRFVTASEAFPETERERYTEAVRLFIGEEHYHAELLARTVHYLGGKLLRRHWTNFVFRRLRAVLGLEFNLQVLLIAELIAEAYYGLLSRQVPDPVVREVCRKIVRDEVGHIAFHRDFFRQLHRGRLPLVTAVWSFQFQLLFSAVERTVWMGHGRCLEAFGVSRNTFARKARGCCRRFLESALHAAPGGRGRRSEQAPAGGSGSGLAAS